MKWLKKLDRYLWSHSIIIRDKNGTTLKVGDRIKDGKGQIGVVRRHNMFQHEVVWKMKDGLSFVDDCFEYGVKI